MSNQITFNMIKQLLTLDVRDGDNTTSFICTLLIDDRFIGISVFDIIRYSNYVSIINLVFRLF